MVSANAPGALCSSMSATCPLAAGAPTAPIGTSRGFDFAAGSANAIAINASTAVSARTTPRARRASGDVCVDDASCVAMLPPLFHLALNYLRLAYRCRVAISTVIEMIVSTYDFTSEDDEAARPAPG